jgi:hypothetical protein
MYRMKKIIFLLLASSSCFAQTSSGQKIFSQEELQQDLTFLFQKLEAIHPDLYHYTPKSKVEEAKAVVEKELTQPMTRMEFARKVTPIVSMLKDAHTSLVFPQEELIAFLKNGGKIFPFDVLIRDNKIFITTNFSTDSTLSTIAEILSINGKPTIEFLTELRLYISAELDFYRDARLQKAFRAMLWNVYGWGDDFELQLLIEGEPVSKKITGITERELAAAIKKHGKQQSAKAYAFFILENRIGVIDFRSMRDLKKFSLFLDSTFAEIKKNNIQHLVIDIRNNGGGDSKLGDALFNYITSKPYKQFAGVKIKNSVEAGLVKNVNSKKNGAIRVIDTTPLIPPKKPSNKFTGKTYLLTSHLTFSSAHALASAFACYHMGTIIGEETGGVLAPFGDLIELRLPNTQLQAWCSHKKFVHPCADETLHGVKPDVEVIPTLEDFRTGKDAVLEYVKKQVQ